MKVLIVEDTQDDIVFAQRKLALVPDMETLPVKTMADATRALLEFLPDMVLLDIKLPDSDENGLREAIWRLRGWAAVVVMTSRFEDDFKSEVEADGADEYLPKRYLTDNDPRLFLTRIVRGYTCFRDRKPDSERHIKIDLALTAALTEAKKRNKLSSGSKELNDEQTDLILTTLRNLVPEVKEIRAGVKHTNGTVSENVQQLQKHELALEDIRLRHERIDKEKAKTEEERLAMEKQIAAKKLEADKKASKDREKMLNWLKFIAGGVLTLLCTYLAHALGWNK